MLAPYLELEKKYAEYIGTSGCVTTNTGTSALHTALEALELNPGDEVIVPEFTMIASAWAVVYAGLKPVFVDCQHDLLIDPNKIEEKITPRTKVIMVTHVYGRVCEMKRIHRIAKKYGLRLIEDACEAQGARYENEKKKKVGSLDIGCFSFYRNKIICAEEGGAITSNDEDFLKKCSDLKSMSFGSEHNYLHGKIGFNYRMTDSQAVLALKSLENVEENLKARKLVESWYNKHLPYKFQNSLWLERSVVWVYDIRVDSQIKDDLVAFLNSKGITARHSFKPMSMQPTFNYNYKNLVSYRASKEVCYLPVIPEMDEPEVVKICNLVKEFFK